MVTRLNQPAANDEGQTDQADPAAPNPELDAIEREAIALEAGTAGAAAPPAVTNTAGELREALGLARLMIKPAFLDWPEYGREVWNDAQLQAIADAGGVIMDRHGLTMGEFWQSWGPYIALIGATAGPSLATWQHLKIRKEQAERARRGREQGQPQDAGQAAAQAAA